MGQFASTAFNGDPYVDVMREMPDREIVWWVQKVIWVSDASRSLIVFRLQFRDKVSSTKYVMPESVCTPCQSLPQALACLQYAELHDLIVRVQSITLLEV